MDEIDQATEHAEKVLKYAILRAANAKRELEPNGKCYNCDARVPKGYLYCDADCRTDHSKRTKP